MIQLSSPQRPSFHEGGPLFLGGSLATRIGFKLLNHGSLAQPPPPSRATQGHDQKQPMGNANVPISRPAIVIPLEYRQLPTPS